MVKKYIIFLHSDFVAAFTSCWHQHHCVVYLLFSLIDKSMCWIQ